MNGKSAIYTTRSGVKLPAKVTTEPDAAGTVYAIFAQGGAANVPADRIEYVEDKDAPTDGLEVK